MFHFLAGNSTQWSRNNTNLHVDDCLDRNISRVLFSIHDRKPSTIQDPCELPDGFYTWTATIDGNLTFGYVENPLEWGVKHIALANKRRASIFSYLVLMKILKKNM
jgi:hypothetical protein